MMTPATGMSPKKKIIIANPIICGNPSMSNTITDKIVLTIAIINWASITFPNVRVNFLPKELNFEVKRSNLTIFKFVCKLY